MPLIVNDLVINNLNGPRKLTFLLPKNRIVNDNAPAVLLFGDTHTNDGNEDCPPGDDCTEFNTFLQAINDIAANPRIGVDFL